MRALTYSVAASLDGYIAGPQGQVDWLFHDQDYGLSDFMASVDPVLIGQATYDFMVANDFPAYPGKTNYVFSRTLRPEDHPQVEVVGRDPGPFVQGLKAKVDGAGIWLVGGGVLCRYLLDADLVDNLVVAVHPVLLGGGIPLLPARDATTWLHLEDVTPYDTGLVTLSYRVRRTP